MTEWISLSQVNSTRLFASLVILTVGLSGTGSFISAQAASPDAPERVAQIPNSMGGPAPMMPSAASQPGAPPPMIAPPSGSFGPSAMPSQPGVPSMQPAPPRQTILLPPVQNPTYTPPAMMTKAPQLAPPLNGDTSITLFENQPAPTGGSGPWGDLLNGSVTKMRSIPIDLASVLKLVEAQNLPIARDRLTVRINNMTYYRAMTDLLPDFQGSYVQSRFQGALLVFGNATVQSFQTRIVPQAILSWTIRPGGDDLYIALAAKQRAKGAKFTVLDTMNNQLTLAANNYYDLLSNSAQVENARLSIQETASQVQLNEARVKAGIGTKLDLERARSQLVAREQILIDAENTLARAQQSLLNILNLDPEVELTPAQTPVQPHPLVPFDVTTDKLVARALVNNPSLQVSAMELRALRDEARATLGRIIPAITLQTYVGGLGPHLTELGLTRFGGFTVQANILENMGAAIPIDYASRHFAVKREMVIRAQQVRDLQTLVINAYLDSRSSAKAIMAAQEQLAVAQEAYRLAFGRFRAGLGINVDVLDAQTVLTAARTTVVQAILAFNQAQVRLLNALGDSTTPNILNGLSAQTFTPTLPTKK